MKYLVYDLEIKNCIPDRNAPNSPEWEYCHGWGDHKGMGIAVVGAATPEGYHVFLEDNLKDFFLLAAEAEVLVTWNGINFDDKVLRAHPLHVGLQERATSELYGRKDFSLHQPEDGRQVDLFARMAALKGGGRGLKLSAVAFATLGRGKDGDGAEAPRNWQRGKFGAVISYCLQDVQLTEDLYLKLTSGGQLKCPEGRSWAVDPFPRKDALTLCQGCGEVKVPIGTLCSNCRNFAEMKG